MARISVPASIEAAPAEAKRSLEAVKGLLGSVPNMFRVFSVSPQALVRRRTGRSRTLCFRR